VPAHAILRLMRPAHVSIAVAVAAIWGLNFVVIAVGLDDFPPLLLSSLRYALASLPLLILRGSPGVPWRWVIAVGVAIGIVKFSLLFIGMDVGMPAGLASLVLQAQALFTVVFAAAVLGERLVASQAVGLAIAFAGLALVATGLQGEATPTGFALVIAAAAAWGVGNLAIKRAAAPDPLRFMSWMCVVPPLPLLCLSLAFEGPHEIGQALSGVDLGGIGAVLYIAFAATTVGWALWARLMGLYPASTVAPFSLLVPIFGIGFAAVLLGEPIGARELVATVLVLGGVLLTLKAPRPVPREAISPQLAASS
jgi:O-acetylserine/cysteine efflux transporter